MFWKNRKKQDEERRSQGKRSPRAKKQADVGNIYVVHPSHVVKKEDMGVYVKAKKGRVTKRPVAVVKVKKDETVAVAQLYGNPGKNLDARTPLSQTKTKKRSWIGVEEKEKSEKTGKSFKVGESPLDNSKKGKVYPRDLKRRNDKIKKVTVK